MSPEDRIKLIDRLDRSFLALPRWAKVACKHAMGSPTHHPETGKEFESFREVIEAASDESLLTIKDDFVSNDDLAPEEVPPEPEMMVPLSKNVIRKDWVIWKARILTHHKEEVIPHASIVSALYAAKDQLDYPNPDPVNLILNVDEDKEEGTFVFSYVKQKELKAESETPE